jgi:hypothetical protein
VSEDLQVFESHQKKVRKIRERRRKTDRPKIRGKSRAILLDDFNISKGFDFSKDRLSTVEWHMTRMFKVLDMAGASATSGRCFACLGSKHSLETPI